MTRPGLQEGPLNPPETMSEAVRNYLSGLEGAGRKPKTLERYGQFLRVLERECPEFPVSVQAVERVILSIPGSPFNRQGAYRTYLAFFNWLNRRYDFESPMKRIIKPKVPKVQQPYFTLSQLQRILTASHPQDLKICLYILSDTGARLGEILNLTTDRVFAEVNQVLLEGKTGQRIVPLSSNVMKMLCEYGPGNLGAAENRYFAYTDKFWSHRISRTIRALGLPGSAHTFRHTFCSLWTGDVRTLKYITGHSSWSVLDSYSHRKLERASQEHPIHSPLNQLFQWAVKDPVEPVVTLVNEPLEDWQKEGPKSVREAVELYIVSARLSGRAEATSKWYAVFLRKLAEESPLFPVSHDAIERCIARDHKSKVTQDGCYRALRAFFGWLQERYGAPDYFEGTVRPMSKAERRTQKQEPKPAAGADLIDQVRDFVNDLAAKPYVTGGRDDRMDIRHRYGKLTKTQLVEKIDREGWDSITDTDLRGFEWDDVATLDRFECAIYEHGDYEPHVHQAARECLLPLIEEARRDDLEFNMKELTDAVEYFRLGFLAARNGNEAKFP